MARDWRRSALVAVAAAVLGGACALGAPARAAEEEAGAEPAQSTPDAEPKSGKKRQDPAEAQRTIETALKQLQAGRPELALPGLTAILAGGNLPPAIMARAFYVRGMAFRQQRRPAQAISDLNSALWLKGGLGGDERAEAVKERATAYADAGLRDTGDTERAPPKTAGGNWLSGVFGGGSNPPASRPAPAPAPPPAARAAEPPAAKAPSAIGSGWSSTTQSQPQRPALAAAAPSAAPRAEAPPAPAPRPGAAAARAAPPSAGLEGHYRVQLAALRHRSEARALIAKAAVRPPWRAGKGRSTTPCWATWARSTGCLRPFASAEETQAVCARLQSSGFDCLPVGP
jgi:cell division septation protein DedD